MPARELATVLTAARSFEWPRQHDRRPWLSDMYRHGLSISASISAWYLVTADQQAQWLASPRLWLRD
jgi:hypothetical protein